MRSAEGSETLGPSWNGGAVKAEGPRSRHLCEPPSAEERRMASRARGERVPGQKLHGATAARVRPGSRFGGRPGLLPLPAPTPVLAKRREDGYSPGSRSAWVPRPPFRLGPEARGSRSRVGGVTRGGGGRRGAVPSQPTAIGAAAGARGGAGSQVPKPTMPAGAVMPGAWSRRRGPRGGQVVAAPRFLIRMLLLAWCTSTCRGAPILPQGSLPEHEPQLWNKLGEACSSFLSSDSQPQASAALKEFCSVVMGVLLKLQQQDEKDNTKRFLFHYSKTQRLGNSNVVSSVVHPLLQLVPRLHERRMKRFRVDEAFQNVLPSPRRGYFLFRPRNG
ncbi:neuromedin-U [Thomomys bottae]